MSEQNQKMTTRSSKQNPTLKKPQSQQMPTQVVKTKPKNAGQKKPMQQKSLFSMGFKKQQNQIIPEPIEVRYSIKELLKQRTIEQILENCPKIKNLYDQLCSKPWINQKMAVNCLDKYFHGNTTSLWSNKYAPRSFNQLFQLDFAEKIEEWVKDFYYFRNEPNFEDQLSFIDDYQQQSYSKSLQVRMREYGWNCRALVLKGRNGVGKTSLLTAIARSMNIRCFQYASDVDQLQKMKQMMEGSQSECVDKYQIKKKQQQNNKLMKQNSLLTKFISVPNVKQRLQTKQPKRMQLFRNFSQYYAPFDRNDKEGAEDSYFKHLFQSINKSPIPYVLTSNRLQFLFRQKHLNQKFSKFDQIEFVENSVEDLTYLYYLIYQIQINLNLCTWVKIPKEDLFVQLNRQFENLQFKFVDNLHLIRELVQKANKKPIYIAKHLQFMVHQRFKGLPSLEKAEEKNNKMKLGFLEQSIQQIGCQILQNITSEGLINNIEWSLYHRKDYQESNPLQLTAADDEMQKSSKSPVRSEKQQSIRKPNLKQITRSLDIEVIEDHRLFQNQYFYYKKNYLPNLFNKEKDNFQSIPTSIHREAKRKMLKNIKSNVSFMTDQKQKWDKKGDILRIPLKQKDMYYLPLIFTPRRPSRTLRKVSNNTTTEDCLSKIMNSREAAYMDKFAKFFSPKSNDQN